MTRCIQDKEFYADVLVRTKKAHWLLWLAKANVKTMFIKFKKILSCPVFTKSKYTTTFTSN